jgi:hypothetical protein
MIDEFSDAFATASAGNSDFQTNCMHARRRGPHFATAVADQVGKDTPGA